MKKFEFEKETFYYTQDVTDVVVYDAEKNHITGMTYDMDSQYWTIYDEEGYALKKLSQPRDHVYNLHETTKLFLAIACLTVFVNREVK